MEILRIFFLTVTAILSALASDSDRNRTNPLCGYLFPATDYNRSLLARSATPFAQNSQGPFFTWPLDANGYNAIWFCYMNEDSRNKIHQNLVDAVNSWYGELGLPRLQASAHRVAFFEARDKNGPRFCKIENKKGEWEWDEQLPYDILVVEYKPEMYGASATIGLHRFSPPSRGSNVMNVGPNLLPFYLAHELGHVMGMAHEHQRADRDLYVRYKCHKVRGYEDKLEDAMRRDWHMTALSLCHDPQEASNYGFDGYNFVAGLTLGPIETSSPVGGKDKNYRYPIHSESSLYDVNSIMHYSSVNGYNVDMGKCQRDLEECNLVKYKDPNNHDLGVEAIDVNFKPSAGDVAWVRRTYPYFAFVPN